MDGHGVDEHRAIQHTNVRKAEIPQHGDSLIAGNRHVLLKPAAERVDAQKSTVDARHLEIGGADVLDERAAADPGLDVHRERLRADEFAFLDANIPDAARRLAADPDAGEDRIDGAGRRPAVLLMSAEAPPASLVETLTKANRVLLALQPRPTPIGTESIKSPYLGPFNLLSMRAFLVGRSLLGLRVDDTIRAVDALMAMREVDRRAVTAYGIGPSGMTLLHAARWTAACRRSCSKIRWPLTA